MTEASRLAVEAAVRIDTHTVVTCTMAMTVVTRQSDIDVTMAIALARALWTSVLTQTVIHVKLDQVHLHRQTAARWYLTHHAHRDPAPCPRRAITLSPLAARARKHRSPQLLRRQPQVPPSDQAHRTRADHQRLLGLTTRRNLNDAVPWLRVTPGFKLPMLKRNRMAQPESQFFESTASTAVLSLTRLSNRLQQLPCQRPRLQRRRQSCTRRITL